MADSLEFTTLGSVVTRTGGALQTGPFGSQLHASDYQPTGTPLIMPVNLGDNEVLEKGIARIGATDAHKLRRHALRDGDIIFSRRGDVGRRSLIRETETGWLCGTGCLAARFGPRTEHVNPAYVAEYLGSNAAQTWLVDNAVGGTMPNLNTSILAALPILLLSKREQDRIVVALGDVQETIRTFERLIAKKQAIKQGMMQQLLTGRTRLPGFSGGWTVTTIGQIAKLRSGRPKAQSPSGQYWIVDMGSVTREGEFVVTKPTSSSEGLLNPGELVMPKDDIGGGLIIGRTGLIKESNKYVLADHVYALTPLGVDSTFLNYLINSHEINVSLRSQATGSAQLGLSRKSVIEQCIRLPATINEQKAISDVISESDLEMNVLRQRLTKARAIKTGMMQQLLTGRTRLPAETAS